jgi:hypothetical protein
LEDRTDEQHPLYDDSFDPTKYDVYIFDCDGTLADTMPLHY